MEFNQTRINRILVPLTGSIPSGPLLLRAQAFAQSGVDVILLGVIPEVAHLFESHGSLVSNADDGRRRRNQIAIREIDKVAARMRALTPGIHVQSLVAAGSPANEILNAALDPGADLIVMMRDEDHRAPQFGFGGVANRVARTSPVPVLLVSESETNHNDVPTLFRRIVVAIDGSPGAVQSMAVAEQLARLSDAPILAVSALTAQDACHSDLDRDSYAETPLVAQQTPDWAAARCLRTSSEVEVRLCEGSLAASVISQTSPGDVVVVAADGFGAEASWSASAEMRQIVDFRRIPIVLVPVERRNRIEQRVLGRSVIASWSEGSMDAEYKVAG